MELRVPDGRFAVDPERIARVDAPHVGAPRAQQAVRIIDAKAERIGLRRRRRRRAAAQHQRRADRIAASTDHLLGDRHAVGACPIGIDRLVPLTEGRHVLLDLAHRQVTAVEAERRAGVAAEIVKQKQK